MPEGEKLEEVKKAIRDQIPEYDLDTYTGYSGELHEDWCEYDEKTNGG
jgi:hypothetical protein